MAGEPGQVKVEMRFGDVRKGAVVEGAPDDQRVRVEVPGVTERFLAEKHPYRRGIYRPVRERQDERLAAPTINIPWWLDMIFTIVGFALMVIEIVIMVLRAGYESIPQKTADRVLLIYSWLIAGVVLAVVWFRGVDKMNSASPGQAYGLGLLAIAASVVCLTWLWRFCSARYPFDPTERPVQRRPTAKETAGLIAVSIVLLLTVVGPTAVPSPRPLNGSGISSATSSANQRPSRTTTSNLRSPAQPEGRANSPRSMQQAHAVNPGQGSERVSEQSMRPASTEIPLVRVPRVIGLSGEAAIEKLEAAGLSPRVSESRPWSDSTPAGCVIRTIPSQDDGMVRRGATVRLGISNGPQPKCQHCQMKFDSDSELETHLSQQLYACSESPGCEFTAASIEDVIRHYASQPQQDLVDRLARPNCRSKAFVIGGEKWRIKVIPAPACVNLKNPETWKLERVRP